LVEFRRHIDDRFGAGLKKSPANYSENNGLLVTRIMPSLNGNMYSNNRYEIYIYRLNGTTTVEGNLARAAYSDEYSRTAINDNTNPRSF
jgi:hypothetical protein